MDEQITETMRVRVLFAWDGNDRPYMPGSIVDLDRGEAIARRAAGQVEPAGDRAIAGAVRRPTGPREAVMTATPAEAAELAEALEDAGGLVDDADEGGTGADGAPVAAGGAEVPLGEGDAMVPVGDFLARSIAAVAVDLERVGTEEVLDAIEGAERAREGGGRKGLLDALTMRRGQLAGADGATDAGE